MRYSLVSQGEFPIHARRKAQELGFALMIFHDLNILPSGLNFEHIKFLLIAAFSIIIIPFQFPNLFRYV